MAEQMGSMFHGKQRLLEDSVISENVEVINGTNTVITDYDANYISNSQNAVGLFKFVFRTTVAPNNEGSFGVELRHRDNLTDALETLKTETVTNFRFDLGDEYIVPIPRRNRRYLTVRLTGDANTAGTIFTAFFTRN